MVPSVEGFPISEGDEIDTRNNSQVSRPRQVLRCKKYGPENTHLLPMAAVPNHPSRLQKAQMYRRSSRAELPRSVRERSRARAGPRSFLRLLRCPQVRAHSPSPVLPGGSPQPLLPRSRLFLIPSSRLALTPARGWSGPTQTASVISPL